MGTRRRSSPNQFLRSLRCALGCFSRPGVRFPRALALRWRRVRLDGMGLSWRADSLRFVEKFLLRNHRSRWIQKGPLLSLSGALASEPSDGPHPPSLELAGTGGSQRCRWETGSNAGPCLYVGRRGRALPERQVARASKEREIRVPV